MLLQEKWMITTSMYANTIMTAVCVAESKGGGLIICTIYSRTYTLSGLLTNGHLPLPSTIFGHTKLIFCSHIDQLPVLVSASNHSVTTVFTLSAPSGFVPFWLLNKGAYFLLVWDHSFIN